MKRSLGPVLGLAWGVALAGCSGGVDDEGGTPDVVATGGRAGASGGTTVGGGAGQTSAAGSGGTGKAGTSGGGGAGQSGAAGSSGAGQGGAAAGSGGAGQSGAAGSGGAGQSGAAGGGGAGKAGASGGGGAGQGGTAGSGSAGTAGKAGGSAGSAGTAGSAGSAGAGGSCNGVTVAPTLTYELASAPFPSPDHPSVAVHVPAGFRPCDHPGLVVFFHGFHNCVANVIGSVDGECTPGDGTRSALQLSDQLDAANVNAVLVAVQLSYDQATGKPGALANPGGLRKLLDELFDQHLSGALGQKLSVDDLDRVVLASHSGGYWATAVSLASGNVPRVTEVQLYDSLYGEEATFRGWVDGNLPRFDATRTDDLRFNTVYTVGGGTLDNAQAMATWVTPKLAAAGLSASLLDDETTATLDEAAFDHPLIFKRSGLSHDGVPRYYFERIVRHAGFHPLP